MSADLCWYVYDEDRIAALGIPSCLTIIMVVSFVLVAGGYVFRSDKVGSNTCCSDGFVLSMRFLAFFRCGAHMASAF